MARPSLTQEAARELGERVRERREALGLSQHALARTSGVERARITRIEGGQGGEHGVGLGTIVRLAKALGVVPGALLSQGFRRAS